MLQFVRIALKALPLGPRTETACQSACPRGDMSIVCRLVFQFFGTHDCLLASQPNNAESPGKVTWAKATRAISGRPAHNLRSKGLGLKRDARAQEMVDAEMELHQHSNSEALTPSLDVQPDDETRGHQPL